MVFRLPLLLQFDSHRIRHGFTAVGDLEHCVHYKVVQHERMKFLCIGTKTGIEVYAWAQKPYSKFMAFKVVCVWVSVQQHSVNTA